VENLPKFTTITDRHYIDILIIGKLVRYRFENSLLLRAYIRAHHTTLQQLSQSLRNRSPAFARTVFFASFMLLLTLYHLKTVNYSLSLIVKIPFFQTRLFWYGFVVVLYGVAPARMGLSFLPRISVD
jgi:hypothetical protein